MPAVLPPQKLHKFDYQPEWEGKRLREIVRLLFPDLGSRPTFLIVTNGLIRTGAGDVIKDADQLVSEGTSLSIDLRHGIHGKGEAEHPHLHERMKVHHDDEHVVVVSKKPWTLVHAEDEGGPVAKGAKGVPLVDLLKLYWKAKGQPHATPILVQRLDLQTSGLLAMAKTPQASANLQRQLKPPRKMHRTYLAIVAGTLHTKQGTWKTYQGRGKIGLRQSIAEDTRSEKSLVGAAIAETRYEVLETRRDATLLKLELETGRTHQIRIHCAEAGHPILGDDHYEKLAENTLDRVAKQKLIPKSKLNPAKEAVAMVKDGQLEVVKPTRKAPRILLHATKLSFRHPYTNKAVSFTEPMPNDMQNYWDKLEKDEKEKGKTRARPKDKGPNGAQ